MKFHAPALFLIAASALLVSCGSDSPKDTPKTDQPISVQPPPPPFAELGTIVGSVKFVGTAPAPRKIAVNKDQQVCGREKQSEELVVNPQNKGVRWAVVSIQRDKDIDQIVEIRNIESVTLDQKGCRFSPHVLVVRPNTKVKVLNPDGVLHNFRTYSQVNPAINKAQPGFKKEMTVTFDKPESPFRIGCDAHSWMSGWIVVREYPFYAITDANGNFRIENVPAGKRVVSMWHEGKEFGAAGFEVKAGQTVKVDFEMK